MCIMQLHHRTFFGFFNSSYHIRGEKQAGAFISSCWPKDFFIYFQTPWRTVWSTSSSWISIKLKKLHIWSHRKHTEAKFLTIFSEAIKSILAVNTTSWQGTSSARDRKVLQRWLNCFTFLEHQWYLCGEVPMQSPKKIKRPFPPHHVSVFRRAASCISLYHIVFPVSNECWNSRASRPCTTF